MIRTAGLNSYFPREDIAADAQLACAEQLLRIVVGEELGSIA